MTEEILEELLAARKERIPCVLATIAATKGSVPREAGSKMLVYADGKTSGTIGGGKFESLVVDDCLTSLREKKTLLKTYPLHEASAESFGAICGGESTVLIEPQNLSAALFLIGGGHVSRAIAKLASECGLHITVVEERAELLTQFPASTNCICNQNPATFISARGWQPDEALLLVSRNHDMDREALGAAVQVEDVGYIGMMGSRRKVRYVFDALREAGVTDAQLSRVYEPLGFDIGADSPAEIAVSAMAEILAVLRSRSGEHLRLTNAR
jgi:xanthine dehydrogenase accessory factor